MTTFAAVGKEVDERIKNFRDKVYEAVESFDESLKSADRQGFERGIKMAARVVNASTVNGAKIVDAIRKIKYTPGE
jgi:hypothetical protein